MAANGFPQRLRAAREARGMLVTELNQRAGISDGSVSRLEMGDRPNVGIGTVEKLADALGVSIEWLWLGRSVSAVDPSGGTFLMALDRRHLREVVERDPSRWKLSTLAKALELDVPSDKDGAPKGGWAKVLDAVQSGSLRSPELAPTLEHKRAKRRLPRQRPE